MTSKSGVLTLPTAFDWGAEPDLEQLGQAYSMLKTNPGQAMTDLSVLAERGSEMSMRYMAEAYRFGVVVRGDKKVAESWYLRAVKLGSTEAAFKLALMYRNDEEYHNLLEICQSAELENYVLTKFLLGVLYFTGEGVERDDYKAKDLFEQAAAAGHFYSKKNLAVLLMTTKTELRKFGRGLRLWLSLYVDIPSIIFKDPEGSESWRLRGIAPPRMSG